MDNNGASFDYGALADLIINQIKEITGCETVETDYSGPELAYPFFSYKITTPHIRIVQQMNDHEPFECTVSINANTESSIQALSLATSLDKQLRTDQVRRAWRLQSVVIVGTDSFGNRDVFQTTSYEHKSGFDLHLRVQDTFEENVPTVNQVNVAGKTGNDEEENNAK